MSRQQSKNATVSFLLTLAVLGVFAGSAQAASWEDVKLKGDLRYRHEMKDIENIDDTRHRQRIRGRVGLFGPINEDIGFGLRLATGSTAVNNSTNQTLENAAYKKEFNLDLYYITWKAMDGLSLTAGKTENPLYRPAGNPMLWDSDVTPEGLAFAYNRDFGAVSTFVNVDGFWHDEHGTGKDQGILAAQLGVVVPLGAHRLTVGAGHNAFANIKGSAPVTAVNGGTALGNSVDGSGNYVNDYRVTEFFAEFTADLGGLPVTVGGSFFNNSEADSDNSGHWAAIKVGGGKERNWSMKFANFKIEADSTLGEYADSDALGGGTDGQGNVFGAAYSPANNFTIVLTYWMSETGISGPTTTDIDLAQLDFVFKY